MVVAKNLEGVVYPNLLKLFSINRGLMMDIERRAGTERRQVNFNVR